MPKSSKAKLAFQKAYNARPEEIAKRVKNNQVRREALREGRVQKGSGKDIAHKRALENGGGNTPGNTVIQDRSTNRGWRKGRKGYSVPNS